MPTDPPKPSEIIERMVDLKAQMVTLKHEIEALAPSFYEACATQDPQRFEVERAIIYRKVNIGRWIYPPHIKEQEEHLQDIKKEFRGTHEPAAGREVTWIIKWR